MTYITVASEVHCSLVGKLYRTSDAVLPHVFIARHCFKNECSIIIIKLPRILHIISTVFQLVDSIFLQTLLHLIKRNRLDDAPMKLL